MSDRDENLKDTERDMDKAPQKDSLSIHSSYGVSSFHSGSYTKASKLVTALYMVTDVIDKDEPIRAKLRNIGAEIISDIHSNPTFALSKIAETLAFLNIASAMSLISEMNANILKKEFIDLNNRIKEYSQVKPNWLEEFLVTPRDQEVQLEKKSRFEILNSNEDYDSLVRNNSIRHQNFHDRAQARIGVQKGSTLMKALSDKTLVRSLNGHLVSPATSPSHSFDILKKQRRDEIVRIVKTSNDGFTITDIKNKAKESPKAESLISCSEKTLQRELISMVKDSILNKTGEKRWSRYFLKK